MGLIPNEIISAVLDRSDITATVGRYVPLKKLGRNFKALCPFHNEKSPSFVVNPDKQIFHCFGCGAGGNAIGFVMRQEHLEFPQAVRLLAELCGVTVPDDGEQTQGPSRNVREDIYKVNELAVAYFHELLLAGRGEAAVKAWDYLKGRGIGLDVVKQFRLGFAADEWDGLIGFLRRKEVSLELMEQAGLIIAREKKEGYYDRFRYRIIFPIFDIQSRAVAFGARALGDEEGAKYINSPETPVYTKGRHLFGLDLAKAAISKLDQVIVVEGYMDMIMPFIRGIENITASLGTALTVDQIRLIRRYTSNVVMLFDADAAGQNAIVRSLDLLVEEGMNVRVAGLDDGQDPDSFIRMAGAEEFRRRMAAAQSLFDYKLGRLGGQFDAGSMEGRSQICRQMMATINRFKDEVMKFELTKALSEKFAIPTDVLGRHVPLSRSNGQSGSPAPVEVALPAVRVPAEEMLLALFLADPLWVARAMAVVTIEDFTDVTIQRIVREMLSISTEQEWKIPDLMRRIQDEPTASALVAGLLSKDEAWLGDQPTAFKDCAAKLRKKRLEAQLQQEKRSRNFHVVNDIIREMKRIS